MSQSLVPNIKVSRGNNRKNKFNVSSNTHTTAEIGYLQPTFSKILLPKSDLHLKVNDFCRMSSLVVPSFGELSLRHWFNCTPLSSLWSCCFRCIKTMVTNSHTTGGTIWHLLFHSIDKRMTSCSDGKANKFVISIKDLFPIRDIKAILF